MKPRAYKVQKLKISVKKGDPWGDLGAQKSLLTSSSSFFLLFLLKKSNIIRLKDSQNHFESTFGSAYFKPNKTELKLAKTVKKGTKENKFSLGYWLDFWESNEMCTYFWILSFRNRNINLIHPNYGFSLNCHAKWTSSLN